jgi:hypothetical protein
MDQKAEDEEAQGLLLEKHDAKVGRRSIRRRLGLRSDREGDRELKRERQALEPSWAVVGGVLMNVEDDGEAWDGF